MKSLNNKQAYPRFLKILLVISLLSLSLSNYAQKAIEGIVSDADSKETLPGVTVLVKGTLTGTVTNFEGKYSLKATPNDTLVFSYIGYQKQHIHVGSNTDIDIHLSPEAEMLKEVVVTALGIKREKKSLGYAVQEMKAKEIESITASNMSSQLAGKIAGLRVTTTNGGPGSSTGLVLRGLNSLKNNQALVVVDGIPVSNNTYNTSGEWGGKDYGNGIGDINPEDIESISVLKGANASALYGSKALNGVLLITTKRGKNKKGIGVSFSYTASIDLPYFLYEMQDEYGAGRNGRFEAVWDTDSLTGLPRYNTNSGSAFGSWGPKMNGQKIIDWNGEERVFTPQPDNYKDVYQNGMSVTRNVALDGGNESTTFRFSFTNAATEDIVPNTTLKRNTLNFSMHSKPNEKNEFDFSMSYINQKAENRLGLSNDALIPRNYVMMPRHITDQSLEESMVDELGYENTWYTLWGWMRNPYWVINEEKNDDVKDRVIASSYYKYNIMDHLSTKFRAATDFYLHDFNSIGPFKGIYSSRGEASNSWRQNFLRTTDFLTTYDNSITEDISYAINAGGMIEYEKYEQQGIASKDGLIVPNFYNPLFAINGQSIEYVTTERQLNSLYGFGQISYKSLCFLDLSLRNDWSSTLPKNNNSYAYPSASLAVVYSELFDKDLQEWFSFGKLRLSYAQVGGDAGPHLLNKGYNRDGDLNIYHLSNLIPPTDLKPEMKHSREIGSEFYFFMNRIMFDFTYYNNVTNNQILKVDVSNTTGGHQKVINAGKITNNGVEIQLKTKPIKSKNFDWEVKLNWAKNSNEVIELAEGIINIPLRTHWNVMVAATEDHPIGTIWGTGIKRDQNGNKLVDRETGLYIPTDTAVILGNAQPDWIAGASTTIRYKNLSLFAHVDFSIGGDIFAGTNLYGYGYSGNFEETLDGRESWYKSQKLIEKQTAIAIAEGLTPEDPRWNEIVPKPTGGIVAEGVFEDGTPNDIHLNPQVYWDQFSSWTQEIHEPFIYDATYIKLREVSLSYNIPKKWTSAIKLKGASLSLFGRNLWLIYSKVPNIDPEANYTNDKTQGLELYSYPSRRTIGFNFRVNI